MFVSLLFLPLLDRLFDWRPEKMRGERAKHEKVAILKNLFEPELFDREVHLIIDYQNDLREECGKCGTVRKVIVYDVSTFSFYSLMLNSIEKVNICDCV
jgi:HIV Tat-specific factor 1